jgi:hypothetical protein
MSGSEKLFTTEAQRHREKRQSEEDTSKRKQLEIVSVIFRDESGDRHG